MEKSRAIARNKKNAHSVDTSPDLYGARPPSGMPILLFGMGGCCNDGSVMVYGCNGISAFFGEFSHPQAIGILARSFQSFTRCATGYEDKPEY